MPPRFIIQDGGTIRETRDEVPSRPRKRQRTDSGIDTGGYSETDCPTSAGPVEDDAEFYRSEPAADCVVRVANIRFKIKGSLLSDASPVLQDILTRHLAETRRTAAPCPEELAAQPREHADFDRLLLIALISHQYRCSTFESWSMGAILRTVASDPVFVSSCSSATFTRIIDVAVRTHHQRLLDATIAQWTARIRRADAPCVPAILAADAHELPRLRGVAYYFHIQGMIAQQTSTTERGATLFHADPKLSNAQVMRLLSGYWSLVSLWERLRRSPPKVACAAGCKMAKGHCAAVWAERWAAAAASEKAIALSSVSVLALLAAMRDQLGTDQELAKRASAQCRLAALDALQKTSIEFEDGLADHFFGCL
ncbi:hypothetical protein B0H10DRAFT_2013738 [Mycena sp. CBHHK59/15]|nr:hypothetical protein B0H10DRAFT_2013738 [Mycena sp. CBHHK59/15]